MLNQKKADLGIRSIRLTTFFKLKVTGVFFICTCQIVM